MEVQEYVSVKKKIYETLIEIIESEEGNDYLDEFSIFYNQFDDLQKQSNHDEMRELLELISDISLNHHRNNNFISKITKIISHYSEQINQNFTNIEIFNYFKNDKLLLLSLFEHEIININKNLYNLMIGKSDTIESEKKKESRLRLRYYFYFYPEFRNFMTIKEKMAMNKQISEEGMNLNEFREKRKTGENGSYLCEIIRNDSVESFIAYVNQKNYSLESKITSSIFETNFFLIENEANFIEYAAFFGSFQIFQYLLLNNVELKPSLWLYVIHGKNAELIHLLEENEVKLPNESYSMVFKESMKCHHNDISNYLKNNFFNEDDQIYNVNDNIKENILSYSFHYHNYSFISDLLDLKYAFCYMCKYNYIKLVELFLKQEIIQKLLSDKEIETGRFYFSDCSLLTQIEIPSSVTSIESKAFYNCSLLENIKIPSSVTSIGDNAFYGCASITQITIPSSVASIGGYVFYKCNKLAKVSILSSITSIKSCSFYCCYSLTNFTIPSSVTSIDGDAFYRCISLTEISIPPSVTSIGESAFSECSKLKEISIPPLIDTIKKYSFYKCNDLEKVQIPLSVKCIGYSAFSCCSSLKIVTIPESVERIDDYAFFECINLRRITIPSSVKLIGICAFSRCTRMVQAKLESSSTVIGRDAFQSGITILRGDQE